jgi:hypothetical protein
MLCMHDNRSTGLRLLLWALPGAHSSFPALPSGILAWELFTGKVPYPELADNDFSEVPIRVVKEGLRPRFPADTPLAFK